MLWGTRTGNAMLIAGLSTADGGSPTATALPAPLKPSPT